MAIEMRLFVILVVSYLAASSAIPKRDTALIVVDNRFRNKEAVDLEKILFQGDVHEDANESDCHLDASPLWTSKIGNSVMSTPIIADVRSDGGREIIISTMRHYVEVLEGSNGRKEPGWPFTFSHSWMIASPLLYDVDGDGIREIIVSTKDGDISFLHEDGMPLYGHTLSIPDLTVPSKWWLDEKYQAGMCAYALWQHEKEEEILNKDQINAAKSIDARRGQRALLTIQERIDANDDEDEYNEINGRESGRGKQEARHDTNEMLRGWLTDQGVESLELFLPTDTPQNFVAHLREQMDPVRTEMRQFFQQLRQEHKDPNTVLLPPKILATPVIGDLEGDGEDEIVVAVSYFYDHESLDGEMPLNFDRYKYVAGSIVVYDLKTAAFKFQTPLEMTNDEGGFRAHLTSSPVLVDLNRDGKLEIVVGTGVGSTFAIDHKGQVLPGFPFGTDAILGGLAVEDIDQDTELEIIVSDANSNLVVFELDGGIKWETRISGVANSPPSVGDVDGDGTLDVVIGTTKGHLFAFNGKTGQLLKEFPIKLGGRIHGSASLIRVVTVPNTARLHIIVATTNGHLSFVDGLTGCIEVVDIGDRVSSAVLVDDITGNGFLDLVVATNAGNVHALSTDIPYDPLNVCLSERSVELASVHMGVAVSHHSRSHRDISSRSFPIQFHIVDEMEYKGKVPAKYRVQMFLEGKQVFDSTYSAPGTFNVELPSPSSRVMTTLEVRMTNRHGQRFSDLVPLSFNMYYYRSFKWLILVPFVLSTIYLYFSNRIVKQHTIKL